MLMLNTFTVNQKCFKYTNMTIQILHLFKYNSYVKIKHQVLEPSSAHKNICTFILIAVK